MEWKWPCVSASVFLCLSCIKNKCCEKATPSHKVDFHNSGLQLSVPGSFLIQLELSEPFRFEFYWHSSLSLFILNTKQQNPVSFKNSVFKMRCSMWCHLWTWTCSLLRGCILLYSSPSVFSSFKTRYLKIFIFMYLMRTLCTLSY